MFTTVQTSLRHTTGRARPFGLIVWLVRLNAAYQERTRIDGLTEEQRRDMGLSSLQVGKIKVAEILARDTR